MGEIFLQNAATCDYHTDHKNFEDYLGMGYDIFKGDPLNSDLNVDPGLRYRVFDMDSCEDDAIPNLRCKSTHVSNVIKSAGEYRDEILRSVSVEDAEVEHGNYSASFSASRSFKDVEAKTDEDYRVYIVGEAACTLYTSVLGEPSNHKLTTVFRQHMYELVHNIMVPGYDLNGGIEKLIRLFGTHFMDRVAMGGKYGEVFDMTEVAKTTSTLDEQSKELKAQAAAQLSASLSGGFSNSNANTNSNSHSQNNKHITSQTYSFGSRPPVDGSERKWAATAEIDPVPIGFNLREIHEAITVVNIYEDKATAAMANDVERVRRAVKKYLDSGSYCQNLLAKQSLSSCDVAARGNTACRLCPQSSSSDCVGKYNKYGGQFLQRQTLRNGQKLKENRAVAYDPECSGAMRSRKLDIFDNGCDNGRCGEGKVNLCCTEQESCMLCTSCGGGYPVDMGAVLNEYGGKLRDGPARREQTGMAAWGWGASCGGGKQAGQMHVCCNKRFVNTGSCQWVQHDKPAPMGYEKVGEPWGKKKGALYCPNSKRK